MDSAIVAETTHEDIELDNEHFTLWLNDDWYIPVDKYGRCVGTCGEGALGFIIQVQSTDEQGSVMALKLPRMVAETHRENAYISELLSQEQSTVNHIFTRDKNNEGINISGLLPANPIFDPLRTPLTIRALRGEPAKWNDALIFVRFEKGQNPFFCLVQPDSVEPYPPQAKAPKISKKQYDKIRTISGSDAKGKPARDWDQIVFFSQSGSANSSEAQEDEQTDGIALFNITEALSPETEALENTWYTCLPSVAYTWAPHTLQEAIGLGTRGASWSLNQHLGLIEQICNGIGVLHHKGMLHADIRPANIVHLQDPQNPERYYLSDYGSFATTNVFPVGRHTDEPAGATIIGPVVEGERTSAFYAPERQSGRERETADMAIIIPLAAAETYYVLVGWKTDFANEDLLDERSQPKLTADEFVDYIEQKKAKQENKRTPNISLRMGDRVQLRDYVFELAQDENVLDKMQLFTCKKLFWTVYHTKIVINENKPFETCTAFPIPRVIELPQWSAATDIYGIGVLCLYSLYADVYDDEFMQTTTPQPSTTDLGEATFVDGGLGLEQTDASGVVRDSSALLNTDSRIQEAERHLIPQRPLITSEIDNDDAWSAVDKLDQGFERMLNYLSDESLFNAVWPKLERLRHQIEVRLQDPGKYTDETLANVVFMPPSTSQYDIDDETQGDLVAATADNAEQQEPRTLRTEAEAVVTQITSTVPGIERLLKPLFEDRTSDSIIELNTDKASEQRTQMANLANGPMEADADNAIPKNLDSPVEEIAVLGNAPHQDAAMSENESVDTQITEAEEAMQALGDATGVDTQRLASNQAEPNRTAIASRDSAKQIYQLGPFVFFMHFILRCLHRQDSMTQEQRALIKEKGENAWMTAPFCESRHEPTENEAIVAVTERLREIRPLIEMGALKGLWTDKIATFDLRPENEIRQELTELQEDKKRWEANKRVRQKRQQDLNAKNRQLVTESMNRTIKRFESANKGELLLGKEKVIEEIRTYFMDTLNSFSDSSH